MPTKGFSEENGRILKTGLSWRIRKGERFSWEGRIIGTKHSHGVLGEQLLDPLEWGSHLWHF